MRIKYLGTAAAEGVPAIFCSCEVCKKARELGGRNIRTRSQAIIDDRLLIDFPPDSCVHFMTNSIDAIKIENCLITHGHTDHLYAEDFEMRKLGYANFENDEKTILNVYMSKKSKFFVKCKEKDYKVKYDTIKLHTVKPFSPFKVDKYTVTALKADHDALTEPFIYIISDGKSTLLYANDTGYFPDETWAYLEKAKPHFDFVSLDCTGCILKYRTNHMGLQANIDVKNRFLKLGLADESTVFCCNHFSHNGGAVYDDFVPLAQKEGFIVSYDSMQYDF